MSRIISPRAENSKPIEKVYWYNYLRHRHRCTIFQQGGGGCNCGLFEARKQIEDKDNLIHRATELLYGAGLQERTSWYQEREQWLKDAGVKEK